MAIRKPDWGQIEGGRRTYLLLFFSVIPLAIGIVIAEANRSPWEHLLRILGAGTGVAFLYYFLKTVSLAFETWGDIAVLTFIPLVNLITITVVDRKIGKLIAAHKLAADNAQDQDPTES